MPTILSAVRTGVAVIPGRFAYFKRANEPMVLPLNNRLTLNDFPETDSVAAQLDPDLSPDERRQQILIESPQEAKSRLEKVEIASGIIENIRLIEGDKLKKRLQAGEFNRLVVRASERLKIEIKSENFDEIAALVVYKALNNKHENVLPEMVTSFLSPDKQESSALMKKRNMLLKHHFIDIIGLRTAYDLENYNDWGGSLRRAHLNDVYKFLHVKDIIHLLMPSCYEGVDPAVRLWKLRDFDTGNVVERNIIIGKAWAWLFVQEGFINDDGSYNLKKIRNIVDWKKLFLNKYSFYFMNKPGGPNLYKSINFGVGILMEEGIVRKELFGFDEDQLFRWEIRTNGMFDEIDPDTGTILIDEITNYLVEVKLPKDGHGLVDTKGNLIASEVRKIRNFWTLYNGIHDGCLESSGIHAYTALQREYGDSFGYEKEKVRPWDIKPNHAWTKEMFRQAFTCSLSDSGLGRLNISEGFVEYSFTKNEFIKWFNEKSKVVTNFWKKFFNEHGIRGGFDKFAEPSIVKAFSILFGVDEGKKPNGRITANDYVTDFLSKIGDRFAMAFSSLENHDELFVPDEELSGFLKALIQEEQDEMDELSAAEEFELEQSVEEWRMRLPELKWLYPDD